MLDINEKKKIAEYIDKTIAELSKNSQDILKMRIPTKKKIDQILQITVSKITPESKGLLSSAYKRMSDKTLSEPSFASTSNKAEFYRLNILGDIENKMQFEVPSTIDYKKSKDQVYNRVASGAVVLVGGAISIALTNVIPVGIACIIAGIMAFLLNEMTASKDLKSLVDQYYNTVRTSLLMWIDELEKYYDRKIDELKERLE